MPRVRRQGRERRAGVSIAQLDTLSDPDLIQLSIDAPGMTEVGIGEPWPATPGHGVEAHRILLERGVF